MSLAPPAAQTASKAVLWLSGAPLSPAVRRLARVRSGKPVARAIDLALWVQPPAGSPPAYLANLSCRKSIYLTEFSQESLKRQSAWARQVDTVFHADRRAVTYFRELGLAAHWLPPSHDASIRFPKGRVRHDVCVLSGSRTRRALSHLLAQLAKICRLCPSPKAGELARVCAGSRLTLHAGADDVDAFLALAAGSLLLAPAGLLTELFRDGEELACYHSAEDVLDLVEHYQENEPLRRRMVVRAQSLLHAAHLEEHRIGDLLAVALGEKETTWSVSELRERSCAAAEPLYRPAARPIVHTGPKRSFVIPVLDHSPASPHNIETLLEDLEAMPGDVLVVFNDPGMAKALSHHPRITRWATMSQNIGVARAWNVGIELSTTEMVFVLNADLSLDPAAIDALEAGLETLPEAACVGPEGSFFDMRFARDYLILGQGETRAPVQVDAVSGFLFGVWREHFAPGGLRFESAYTPCFFEEWDLGLQIKRLNKKSYVVPTTAYTHHGSGTLACLKRVPYLGQTQTPAEILARNRYLFLLKWRDLARREGRDDLLSSHFVTYGRELARTMLATDRNGAARALGELAERAPNEPLLQVLAGLALGLARRPAEAFQFYRKAAHLDPDLEIDRFVQEFMKDLVR